MFNYRQLAHQMSHLFLRKCQRAMAEVFETSGVKLADNAPQGEVDCEVDGSAVTTYCLESGYLVSIAVAVMHVTDVQEQAKNEANAKLN